MLSTIFTLLDVDTCLTHRLALSPSRCRYTTYFPSGEIAGATAFPLSVN